MQRATVCSLLPSVRAKRGETDLPQPSQVGWGILGVVDSQRETVPEYSLVFALQARS